MNIVAFSFVLVSFSTTNQCIETKVVSIDELSVSSSVSLQWAFASHHPVRMPCSKKLLQELNLCKRINCVREKKQGNTKGKLFFKKSKKQRCTKQLHTFIHLNGFFMLLLLVIRGQINAIQSYKHYNVCNVQLNTRCFLSSCLPSVHMFWHRDHG